MTNLVLRARRFWQLWKAARSAERLASMFEYSDDIYSSFADEGTLRSERLEALAEIRKRTGGKP